MRIPSGDLHQHDLDQRFLAGPQGCAATDRQANGFAGFILVTPGTVHSVAVKSNGAYGFDPEVWAGMPVRTIAPGAYEPITTYVMDDFAKSKIAATNKELVEERAFVAELVSK